MNEFVYYDVTHELFLPVQNRFSTMPYSPSMQQDPPECKTDLQTELLGIKD